jgi:hypothetical protein
MIQLVLSFMLLFFGASNHAQSLHVGGAHPMCLPTMTVPPLCE